MPPTNPVKAGETYNQLTVMEVYLKFNGKQNQKFCLCKCSCGAEREVSASELYRGHIKQCKSCKTKQMAKTKIQHGDFKGGAKPSKLYYIWDSMKKRCSPNQERTREWYYGKGIRVCDEWMSFQPFKDWAYANGYEEDRRLSIERKDVNGNYEPSNCKWIPLSRQQDNRTDTIWVYIGGEKMNLIPALEKFNNVVSYHGALQRIKRGWDHEVAVSKPMLVRKKRGA